MTITDVDGRTVEVTSSTGLQLEIDRFEAEVDVLMPIIGGADDAAAAQAEARYNQLALRHSRILAQMDDWNVAQIDEDRERRRKLAAALRERRRHG